MSDSDDEGSLVSQRMFLLSGCSSLAELIGPLSTEYAELI